MENKTIRWCGYEWLTQERWGQVHPEKPNWWYDESAITILENDNMVLRTQYNPKEFDGFTSNIGVGLVSCTEKFGYGKYSIEAKLPKGPYLWPAFWMWSFESWPPEIDVFEGYSNKRSSYFNWNLRSLFGNFWAVNTNIHLGISPDNYMMGDKSHWLGWRNPSKVFNKYGLIWTENEIKILFNDKVVRKITDEKVLNQFKGKTLNVIINNSVQDDYLKSDKPEHEMLIKYFKYEKY